MTIPIKSFRTALAASCALVFLTGCGAAVESSNAVSTSIEVTAAGNVGEIEPITGSTDADIKRPVAQYQLLLDGLEVKGRAPKSGYSRDFFGQAWTDDVSVEFGHNGCDTRNDILRRDLQNLEIKPGTNDCVAKSGTLVEPYSGETISFVRGNNSGAVQIDHVVALADAYQKGAQGWDEQKRKDFANDPLNLLAADGPLNQQKGAGDAATWLPPKKSYRCSYTMRIIAVKAKYEVWVTKAEHEALGRQLGTCKD